MFDLPSIVKGYAPAVLALVLITVYFVLVLLITRRRDPQRVSVTRYQPPAGISPAVAAWLFERDLSRAMAAALVNMSAKGYLKIEQKQDDLCTIAQLQPESTPTLEREENVLSYNLFNDYDRFAFREPSPQLIRAVRMFELALKDTGYFSSNAALSYPSWIVSGVGVFLLLGNTDLWSTGRLLAATAVATFVSFVVGVAAMRGTVEKLATRLPGSTSPQRPWTGADAKALPYLCVSLGGIYLFGVHSSAAAALIIFAFLVVNGFFFHSLQGLTRAGREVLAQLSEYRKFLSEVDADVISRLHVCDHVPAKLTPEDAFAVALHLDLGWGEQFVSSITAVVERAALSKRDRADNIDTAWTK